MRIEIREPKAVVVLRKINCAACRGPVLLDHMHRNSARIIDGDLRWIVVLRCLLCALHMFVYDEELKEIL